MLCHVGAEFGSGVDAELAVGAAEVRFDGLGADQQGSRHLLVGESRGGESRDAFLGGREGVRGAWGQAEASDLRRRLVGPER
jgi:hypothetical protein